MKLRAMPCRATQDRQVMVESSDKTWSTGEGNGKPLQYSCLENPMSSMKRQKKTWHWKKNKKQESSTKTSASDLLTTPKPLTVWITTNCGEFFKRWEYQTALPASWEICMQVRKQQLELDMEQQAGSKLGKEYIKTVYCHPAYLAYMQSISYKMPCAGWSTSWNQDCREKYQ